MDKKYYWQQIYDKNKEIDSIVHEYWDQFSDMLHWQFWVLLLFLLLPLILLYFLVDRKRIFELFFFGYTVHILWSYIVIALSRHNIYTYKYFLFPDLPFAVNVTASILPVGFLLMYQYCTNKRKNFILYTLLLSAIFSFGFGSIEKSIGFIELKRGMNQLYLFLIDLFVVFIAYWATRLVRKLRTDS